MQRLAVFKVVSEFLAFIFLAFDDRAEQMRMALKVLTQRLAELRNFGNLFHNDLPRTFQCIVNGIDTCFYKWLCCLMYVNIVLLSQLIRQRLQTCLPRNLRFGAPTRFVRQIQVFQIGFGFNLQQLLF